MFLLKTLNMHWVFFFIVGFFVLFLLLFLLYFFASLCLLDSLRPIETSQLICTAIQLAGFHTMGKWIGHKMGLQGSV